MPTEKVNIVISAQDNTGPALRGANKRLGKFGDSARRHSQGIAGNMDRVKRKAEKLAPTFRKAALFGTASFGAVTAAIGTAVNAAGKAEKIGQNFRTTFDESTEAVNDFITDFADKFAFVESEMKDGASSIGFQLNAMGEIGKEEGEKITKSLLTAAGGLSDFFGDQMDVVGASRALAKGLAGNRAQLIDMGFNVAVEDIKEMAESMGMNTDELTKSQEALAFTKLIMEQTTGSVSGLKEGTDDYTRKKRELRKALKETSETLGKQFIPMAKAVLDIITPVIEKVGEWVKKHPELTKILLISTGVLSGLLAVVGLIGIALPSIIAGFGVVASIMVVLAGPVGIIIGLFTILGIIFATNKDKILSGVEELKEQFQSAWQFIDNTFIQPFLSGIQLVNEGLTGVLQKIGLINEDKTFGGQAKEGIAALKDLATGKSITGQEFQSGGIVPGRGPVPATVHGGEMVLNKQQQNALFEALNQPRQINFGGVTINNDADADRFIGDLQRRLGGQVEMSRLGV